MKILDNPLGKQKGLTTSVRILEDETLDLLIEKMSHPLLKQFHWQFWWKLSTCLRK